jgi:hypothetical protein
VHLVCSAMGGVKLVQVDAVAADVGVPVAHTALDCPACLPLIAPPAADLLAPLPTGNLSHVLQPLPAARLASLLGQPWQALCLCAPIHGVCRAHCLCPLICSITTRSDPCPVPLCLRLPFFWP